jgi:hypothetical protein
VGHRIVGKKIDKIEKEQASAPTTFYMLRIFTEYQMVGLYTNKL